MLAQSPEVHERNASPTAPSPTADMVWVPGGTFRMGSDSHYPEEAPAHRVAVDGFWIDRHPVTNERFARFVAETGHVTYAEIPPNPADYPRAIPELLHPGSLLPQATWWVDLRRAEGGALCLGADWAIRAARERCGPEHSVSLRSDAAACHAASRSRRGPSGSFGRGGLTPRRPPAKAADVERPPRQTPGGEALENTLIDGWEGTSPVGTYAANGYGIHDMIGNVWEWTDDWYRPHHQASKAKACCIPRNPRGGGLYDSLDPRHPDIKIPRKVLKGGSHLCSANYCMRYRPAARFPEPIDTSASHVGFRCIIRPARSP
jgi:formylglycine-generating enzyme required for sulfatase activity